MSVVMTGGTGFLGLHLVRGMLLADRKITLLARGGIVPVIERVRDFLSKDGALTRLKRPLNELVTVVRADLELPDLGLSTDVAAAVIRDAEEIWHVAATVMLDGRDREVWHANVEGTLALLRLADQAPTTARLRYVSTAFVAGSRRLGDVSEDNHQHDPAFENVYERSKHAAEAAVRAWAVASGRSALILRPSILVPSNGKAPVAAEHTLRKIGQIAARMGERCPATAPRLVLRIGADPRAQLNLVQVDWAAAAMLRLAEQVVAKVFTVHVVHESDVPVRSISAALEAIAPVRFRMMPAAPVMPTMDERIYHRLMTGFMPYLYHRRRFDTARLRASLPGLAPPPPIGHTELRDWVTPVGVFVESKVAA